MGKEPSRKLGTSDGRSRTSHGSRASGGSGRRSQLAVDEVEDLARVRSRQGQEDEVSRSGGGYPRLLRLENVDGKPNNLPILLKAAELTGTRFESFAGMGSEKDHSVGFFDGLFLESSSTTSLRVRRQSGWRKTQSTGSRRIPQADLPWCRALLHFTSLVILLINISADASDHLGSDRDLPVDPYARPSDPSSIHREGSERLRTARRIDRQSRCRLPRDGLSREPLVTDCDGSCKGQGESADLLGFHCNTDDGPSSACHERCARIRHFPRDAPWNSLLDA